MVECEVAELGTSSVKTRERIMDPDGAALVEAEFGIVLWDPELRSSRPITDEERVALERGAG
jgi:acyl-CoA thioesterase FadM